MVYVAFLSNLLGIGQTLILVISAITFGYSIMASFLAFKRIIDIRYTRMLILANWIWSAISLIILFMHFENASLVGKCYLALQVIAVGGLAYMEGAQITKQLNTLEI